VIAASELRVVIPYTVRHIDTLRGAPVEAEWHSVRGDPEAYWRLMCELWERGEDLLIIEHDVVPHADVVPQVEVCPQPWCLFGYADICHAECMEAWANHLGCTRFRGELMRAVPHAVSSSRIRDWHNLCDGIGENLRAAGYTHHWHYPPVCHHHMRLQ
jgi:hypothetical protein